MTRIAGGGRTLVPGLIDAHVHRMFASIPQTAVFLADIGYVHIAACGAATGMLMRGFTSVRDLGGPTFGLERLTDEGLVPGPRIWPSGAFFSQRGGTATSVCRTSYPRRRARRATANGWERRPLRTILPGAEARREQLALGASQIRLMAGGGVSSSYDPLDVTQYTVTVRLMAEADEWWSLQPFLDDRPSPFPEGSANRIKHLEKHSGTDSAYALAKKHGITAVWGADVLFDAAALERQTRELSKLVRWYTPAEVLRMATSGNAGLLALSGLRSPYAGRLGVVEEGAPADLLLVDGDPLADITLIDDPERAFVVIMKDGVVYRNRLP